MIVICDKSEHVEAAKGAHAGVPVLDREAGCVHLPDGETAPVSPWRAARAASSPSAVAFKVDVEPAPEPAEPIP